MDLKLNEYIREVRSSNPTPGGGSVSALGGALASSLVIMVSSLSKSKKIYRQTLEDDVKKVYDENLEKLTKLSNRLASLVELDCDAFNKVANAYKISKDNNNRDIQIQNSLKQASEVPLETCSTILDSIKLLYFYIDKTIQSAITDLGCACALFHSSFYGASLNVKTNLESIEDKEYVNSTLEQLENMENEMYNVEGKIYSIIKGVMKY